MRDLTTVDRFSDLPWGLLNNILGRLSVRDAVRTNILSRRWRDKWVDLSKLEFDEKETGSKDWNSFARLVSKLLLSHRGQVDKFTLNTQIFDPFYEEFIDNWMNYLSRNGIKDLRVNFNSMKHKYKYLLPESFFSCTQLEHLYFTDCFLETPDAFNRFSNLVSLQLKRFSTGDQNDLKRLIRRCPSLEILVLSGFSCDSECLNIYAPNLKYLYLEGEFKDFYLEDSPDLDNASFKMTSEVTNAENWVQGMPYNLVGNFERLCFSGYFLKFFAARCVSAGAVIAFDHLKALELSEVHFDNLGEVSIVLSILRSSPNLKELSISISWPADKDAYTFTGAQAQQTCCLNQLQVVKIHILEIDMHNDIEDWRCDLKLIKLLLARSPVLEKMLVYPKYYEDWFVPELLLLDRASTQVIIKYLIFRNHQASPV